MSQPPLDRYFILYFYENKTLRDLKEEHKVNAHELLLRSKEHLLGHKLSAVNILEQVSIITDALTRLEEETQQECSNK